MTFGYDADVVRVVDVASSNTLRDHGKSVANELAVRRMKTKTKHRPLILVAHSLGGLVCEQALLVYDRSVESYLRATLEAVHGIIFLGTPHAGSDLAKWGNLMTGMSKYFRRTNSDIMRTFRPNSEMLANLQQEFHNMVDCCRKSGRPDLKIFCFYEDLGITGLGEIVPKHSAILSGYDNQSIHSDHKGMTRFYGPDDNGYILVSGWLQMWAEAIQDAQSSSSEEVRDARVRRFGTSQIYSTVNSTGSGSVFQGNGNVGSMNTTYM